MSERMFLFVVGATILSALYIELDTLIYVLCAWLLIEGITNMRLTTLTQKLINKVVPSGLTVFKTKVRCEFNAYRAWRIMVAVMLGGSFVLLIEYQIEILWFFPWFMGFAIMGAGTSGICPMLLLLRWVGFK